MSEAETPTELLKEAQGVTLVLPLATSLSVADTDDRSDADVLDE